MSNKDSQTLSSWLRRAGTIGLFCPLRRPRTGACARNEPKALSIMEDTHARPYFSTHTEPSAFHGDCGRRPRLVQIQVGRG